MPIISLLPQAVDPKLSDELVGTSVGPSEDGQFENPTYNFTLQQLLTLFLPNIPANNLQGVLDYGNTATQDINLFGTVYTTNLDVSETANLFYSHFTEEAYFEGLVFDKTGSSGILGQVLSNSGDGVEWITLPPIFVPNLQQVLAEGNTAENDIVLDGNIQANRITADEIVSSGDVGVYGLLIDGSNSAGTIGQVLESTGSGVVWQSVTEYSAISPLLLNSVTKAFSIQLANNVQNGYLSSTDWITFDGKQNAIVLTTNGSNGAATFNSSTLNIPNYSLSGLGGVPLGRNLTINGATYNLSEDRTWNVGTVLDVTTSAPLSSSGGTTPNISISQANGSQAGFLSSADWNTFNNKQPAGNYITSLTGEASGNGPGAASVTLNNTAVIGKVLTGLNITGGTVVSTDSILDAFGKVQNQINGLIGGSIYKGTWNASTNTPTIQSGVGQTGWYYIVNVAGTTDIDGISDWNIGDWIIFDGDNWQQVDNTDAVVSVNGFTGAVNLATTNIPEGTNLYYTDSRARQALSFAAGSGAYNATTGVITIPTDNSQIANGSNYIVLGSLSASAPLSYNSSTGAFSISQSGASSNGYLSSTDWNLFNNKQDVITGTGLVLSNGGIITYVTDNSAEWDTSYDNMIVSAAVTGTLTKTLTLTQQDGGTITASWTDIDTNLVTSVFGRTGAVVAQSGDYSTTLVTEGTNLYYLDSRARAAISSTAAAILYNNTTGVISLEPTYTIPLITETNDWDTAYNNSIVSAEVTGTSTKTLTLNQQDGGTITANWSDADTGLTSVGVSMPSAFNVSNSPLTSNGTIAITGAGTTSQYVRGDGSLATLPPPSVGGGGVSYYLNGGTSQGTIGGNAYEEMSRTAVIATGVDFSINADGYIANFITDTGDPSLLNIPAGNWNFQLFFSASSGGGSPSFYVELYKYDGTTLTLIAQDSANPEVITGGTSIDAYLLPLAVPETTLDVTDRLAIRIYVIHSGKTITLHTQGPHLCQVATTFSTGISALNGLTDQVQYFATGTSGSDFNINSVSDTHTFNLPTASATVRGALSSADWTTFNNKQNALTIGDLTSSSTPVLQITGGTNSVIGSGVAISIQQASGINSGYLSSTDWNTFNTKQNAITLTTTGSSGAATFVGDTLNIPNYTLSGLGGVPSSRLLSINGTQYDLSADRSWSVGTVTSVAALTLGTSGTDLSSTVATGTTTPVITLNVPTASSSNRGVLSSADWSTFNNKVGTVTASSPLASSGGASPNITIQQATATIDGYLSSTDWNTFNNKQAAGNYITSLTGEVTASGPGAAAATLNNASVTGKVLTGVNITGGSIAATDSMLTAFGKLQNQINSLIGGSIYQGTWNASTNTPTLTSSVGTNGYYYIVNVAGSTNLNGITDWKVGDWAIFHGGTWQKVDNTDAVTSVNGQVGAVSLTTDNISEGTSNLYFLNSRARGAVSFTPGSGAYNSSTGVFSIPTNTNQLTNGANFITLGSLSGTAPISYNSGTGAISISQSGSGSNGFLSSTDWNTFNNKQAALSGTGIVLSTGGTISYVTNNSGNWNTAFNDSIVSASFSGTTTKTLTLTQQDGGTITASFTDANSGGTVTSVSGTGGYGGLTLSGTVTSSGSLTLGGTPTGTWPINISGNAETVDGYSASTSTLGNHIVVRDGNGYIFGNYINMTDDGNPGGGLAITSFITKQGDNYYRSVSPSSAAERIRQFSSGTWGIDITGSSQRLDDIANYSWAQSTLPTSYSEGMQLSFVGPNPSEGSWQNYGTVINARTYAGGGGSLQMYVPYGPNNGGDSLQVRFGDYSWPSYGNQWTSWKTLITDQNIGNYSVGSAQTASYATTAGMAYSSGQANNATSLGFSCVSGGDTFYVQTSCSPGFGSGNPALIATSSNFYSNRSIFNANDISTYSWDSFYYTSATPYGYNVNFGNYYSGGGYGSCSYSAQGINGYDSYGSSVYYNGYSLNATNGGGYNFNWSGYNNGNLYIGGTLYQNQGSDAKLKDNVIPIPNALDKVKAIRGVEFDWNELAFEHSGKEGHDVGVIAQEVQAVYPFAVREHNREAEDKVYSHLVVDYDKLNPLAIQAIKELATIVDDLKLEIQTLKSQINGSNI